MSLHEQNDGKTVQTDFSSWVAATSDPKDLQLAEPGFAYADLFSPPKLRELTARFDAYFRAADPDGARRVRRVPRAPRARA